MTRLKQGGIMLAIYGVRKLNEPSHKMVMPAIGSQVMIRGDDIMQDVILLEHLSIIGITNKNQAVKDTLDGCHQFAEVKTAVAL
jgi:hypothetical protein